VRPKEEPRKMQFGNRGGDQPGSKKMGAKEAQKDLKQEPPFHKGNPAASLTEGIMHRYTKTNKNCRGELQGKKSRKRNGTGLWHGVREMNSKRD